MKALTALWMLCKSSQSLTSVKSIFLCAVMQLRNFTSALWSDLDLGCEVLVNLNTVYSLIHYFPFPFANIPRCNSAFCFRSYKRPWRERRRAAHASWLLIASLRYGVLTRLELSLRDGSPRSALTMSWWLWASFILILCQPRRASYLYKPCTNFAALSAWFVTTL